MRIETDRLISAKPASAQEEQIERSLRPLRLPSTSVRRR
jgi:hypothetical protein